MLALAARREAGVIAVQDVPRAQTGSYGIVATGTWQGHDDRIRAVVEKPKPEEAPGTLAVVGRYVLPPQIFERLENQTPGRGGEIQLTDAIAALLQEQPMLAHRFEGRRFDCGSRIGLVEATIQFALEHEDLAEDARRYMRAALRQAE
jgi:UTP--glucose-1-phosphate uridylyltransferase